MKYDRIGWGNVKKCSPGLAVEQKLTISISKIVGVGGSVIRGNRDKPEFVKQSEYAVQVENARKIYVVLYDVATRRAWLVDGASALLHLVRTQVVQGPYGGPRSLFNNPEFNRSNFKDPSINGGPNIAIDILTDEENMKHIILREFASYEDEKVPLSPVGNEAPASTSRKEVYRTTCWRELVCRTWSTLEHIYDRQRDIATTHTTKALESRVDKTLEGYEFMDIVSGEHELTRRCWNKLQSNGKAWTNFMKRIHAVTLFGEHFGDIYLPADDVKSQMCIHWERVPQGHDFLAVPIAQLKDIREQSRRRGEVDEDAQEIAEGLYLCPSKDAFHTCGQGCKHRVNRVQRFSSSKIRSGVTDIFTKSNGAVIFGTENEMSSVLLDLFPPSMAPSENSFHDSGLSSLSAASRVEQNSRSSWRRMLPFFSRQKSRVDT